ncbi:DUF222 domain-containing protein [Nocardioides sp.]|uniref:HNH endonuclease signature motif containing protein n=1 Tax=Nocardioides sp. TaxID=35761 RepID=UPI0035648178
MAISALEHPSPLGVLGDASAQIRGLTAVLWAAQSSSDLVALIEEIETLRSTVAAVESAVLREVDARQVAKAELGWGSTADWFGHVAGLRRAQATRAVAHARQLHEDRGATLQALSDGSVSPEQAQVVLDGVDALPTSPHLRDRAERLLLTEAGQFNASDLARTARHLVNVADPDGSERAAERELDRDDRAAHLGRFLSISDDGAGGVRLKGRGTMEDAATLRAALLPLTAPVPTVDPETCAEQSDPRDHGARLWDALVEVAQHALDTDLPPASHGARPRVTVATELATLRGALADCGVTDDGLELAPSVVRRLACDADIIPIALGTAGEVLDVGRAFRLVTPALWRAVVCRDQHCAFPGCTRPPLMCHAHHIQHWADGGDTALSNLVLLCGHHHRTLHHSPWQVRLRPSDGRPEFRPPPKSGRPSPEWIRHRPRRE